VDTEDEDLWIPFLAARPRDRKAERLRAHLREDERRGQRHAPRRGAALSRDEIVRTAIRVADAEGADAVSMRRIARELNAGTMSLYWHIVSGKSYGPVLTRQATETRSRLGTGAGTPRLARGGMRQPDKHPWLMDHRRAAPQAPGQLRNLNGR
jgi:hypothetical protein